MLSFHAAHKLNCIEQPASPKVAYLPTEARTHVSRNEHERAGFGGGRGERISNKELLQLHLNSCGESVIYQKFLTKAKGKKSSHSVENETARAALTQLFT